MGQGIIRIDIQESLFDPDGEFRAGSTDRALLVDVVFRGSPNLTNRMTGRGIELEMIDGYEAIFTAGTPVHQATIEAHMMFSDAFGNEFLGAVYGTKLMGDTIQGADWSTKETID